MRSKSSEVNSGSRLPAAGISKNSRAARLRRALAWIEAMPPDWADALRNYLAGRVAPKLEETTFDCYNALLRLLARWAADQKVSLMKFDVRKMRAYSLHRQLESEVSDATRRKEALLAKNFFAFCQKEGFIKRNPLAGYEIPRAKRAYVYKPSRDELSALIAAVVRRFDPKENPKIANLDPQKREFYKRRNIALICMQIEAGCRIDEILSLSLENYRPQSLLIVFPETKGDEPRIVPIDPESHLMEVIDWWLQLRPERKTSNENHGKPTTLLFTNDEGEQVSYRAYARFLQQTREFAGLPRFTSHGLRHYTTNNHTRVNLYDAMHIAGHKDIKTTQIYQQTDVELLRETHSLAAPLKSILDAADSPLLVNKRAKKRKRAY